VYVPLFILEICTTAAADAPSACKQDTLQTEAGTCWPLLYHCTGDEQV